MHRITSPSLSTQIWQTSFWQRDTYAQFGMSFEQQKRTLQESRTERWRGKGFFFLNFFWNVLNKLLQYHCELKPIICFQAGRHIVGCLVFRWWRRVIDPRDLVRIIVRPRLLFFNKASQYAHGVKTIFRPSCNFRVNQRTGFEWKHINELIRPALSQWRRRSAALIADYIPIGSRRQKQKHNIIKQKLPCIRDDYSAANGRRAHYRGLAIISGPGDPPVR